MYDFYANPPQSRKDLRDWLTSWLQKPTPEPVPLLEYNGEQFVQHLGFRRAFHMHCVFRSLSTNEYLWWVFEEQDFKTFPIKRYPTYESLLEDIINEYYKSWKLTGDDITQ